MKRLGIFVFYDKDGIVDDYVIYLISELKKCMTDLVVVVNGSIGMAGKVQLEKLADRLYVRENKGYDAMAYKLALTDYLGWDKIVQYDEVLLTNDTYYGPFYPFQDLFDTMAHRNADFWGISCQRESADYFSYNQRIIPSYIQSFFCVFRKSVLCHAQFQEYWNQFDSTQWIFSDVTNLHEKVFTKKLESMGFVWDTYIKEPDFDSKDPKQNFIQYYYIAYQLLKDQKCPVMKRKSFVIKHLTQSYGGTGEDILRALRYIEENTSYDTDMIWDNLLRLYDIGDIYKTLSLNFICSDTGQLTLDDTYKCKNAAAVVYLTSLCCLDECMEYLIRISHMLDVYLLSDSGSILQRIREKPELAKIETELVPASSQVEKHAVLLKKALETAGRYEYMLFLHDVDYANAKNSRLLEYSKYYNQWANLAAGESHIYDVCQIFQRNPRLGMLIEPQMMSGTEFGTLGSGWNGTLDSVRQFLKDMKIRISLSDQAECLNRSHAFWCRTQIIKSYGQYLEEVGMETAVRCYPYLAQAEGYYTGTVMNPMSASVMYTNMQETLKSILRHTRSKYDFTDFDSYLDGDALSYSRKFKRVMVYGAGENGYSAACLLKNHDISFAGYIVSDGQPHDGQKYGDPVTTVSKLPEDSDSLGIIVSVANPKFQAEIAGTLHRQGYQDIYIL